MTAGTVRGDGGNGPKCRRERSEVTAPKSIPTRSSEDSRDQPASPLNGSMGARPGARYPGEQLSARCDAWSGIFALVDAPASAPHSRQLSRALPRRPRGAALPKEPVVPACACTRRLRVPRIACDRSDFQDRPGSLPPTARAPSVSWAACGFRQRNDSPQADSEGAEVSLFRFQLHCPGRGGRARSQTHGVSK